MVPLNFVPINCYVTAFRNGSSIIKTGLFIMVAKLCICKFIMDPFKGKVPRDVNHVYTISNSYLS
jgi:hypothetical protein